jgi:two-component sensor histidine kinase
MLREIHHRVRNNLQVVSSLIQIEALHLSDPETCHRLAEVSRRIGAMGHLHEQLYTSADLTSVDCGEHLRRLCQSLVAPYEAHGLGLAATVEPLRCDLDTAIPLGLVAHELFHAAVHGMVRGEARGEIALALRREGQMVVLAVRGGVDHAAALGDRILLALAAQLDGCLTQQGDFAVLRLPATRFDC